MTDLAFARYIHLIANWTKQEPIKGSKYTQVDRDEVIALHKSGMGTRSIAEELCIARSTVVTWLKETP